VVLVFELMEGGDLHNYLSSRGRTAVEMAIGEDEAKALFYQLLSAISYAHNQHICHRDLKLENILLKEKSLQQVKIADFGLSDFYRYAEITITVGRDFNKAFNLHKSRSHLFIGATVWAST
jgi:serine/threonine protein kinase